MDDESNISPTANGRLNEPDVPPDCAAAAMNSSKSQVTSGSDANGSVPGCDVKVSRCSLGSANNHAVMRRRLRTKSHWSREKK